MSEIIFDSEYSEGSRQRLAGQLSASLAGWIAATYPRLAGHLAGHPEEKSVIAVHVAATGLEAEESNVWCLFLLHLDSPGLVDPVDSQAAGRGVLFVGGEAWIRTKLAGLEAQLEEQLHAPGVKASVACS